MRAGYVGCYLACCIFGAVLTYLVGTRWSTTDVSARDRMRLSVAAGMVWPILLLGIIQAAAVAWVRFASHAAGRTSLQAALAPIAEPPTTPVAAHLHGDDAGPSTSTPPVAPPGNPPRHQRHDATPPVLVAMLTIVVAVAGCSPPPAPIVTSTPAADDRSIPATAEAGRCAPLTAPSEQRITMALPGTNPLLAVRIPVMPGWTPSIPTPGFAVQIKYVPHSAAHVTAPTIMVTVSTPQPDVDEYVRGLSDDVGVSAFSTAPASVCGTPARRMTYTRLIPGSATPLVTTGLVIGVPTATNVGPEVVGVFGQTPEPTNARYQSDVAAVLTNIQLSA